MFNSTILEIAIGMIFIYLLLSLMCSAANEIIELLLKKRAIDLERGIRELLEPGSDSGTTDIVQEFYNHPLINGLFEGSYEESRIATSLRWVARTALPSYIPARNFALAILDLIAPGAAAIESGAANATVDAPAAKAPAEVVVNVAGVAAPAVVPPPDPAVAALRAALMNRPNANQPAANQADANRPDRIPAAVTSQITNQMRRALIPLIDAAGNDMSKVRENIETWFNTSMERVSGWYKRRTQIVLLILGLFVAVTMNVDTITAVKRLSTDKALRESLVAAADAYSKANASPAANPTAPDTSPTPDCAKDKELAECKRAENAQDVCKDPNSKSIECKRARDLLEACKGNGKDSPKCKYLQNEEQLLGLGLPLGWDSAGDPQQKWPAWDVGAWWRQTYSHGLGWLLTALAISLGAPFWFDLLGKFITVRSALKPKEKTP